MCCARGPAGSYPPRFELGSGWVGRERTLSREESAATSAGHSPCLREVNVPDGRRSPLPSPDTVVCQERVARHLAFCPTPAPATIRYGVLLVRAVVTGSIVEVSPRASQRRTVPGPLRAGAAAERATARQRGCRFSGTWEQP